MILSDFPVFLGVKWLKFNCNVVTTTTYEQWVYPSNIPLRIRHYDNQKHTCYLDYYFTTDYGFIGSNEQKCYGNAMTGYYVSSDSVYQYGTGEYVGSDYGGPVTEYLCPMVAGATRHTTTTYSKGGTSYGAVYADKNDLPADGQLIEGSANDAYCVIRTGGTYYYFEKSI